MTILISAHSPKWDNYEQTAFTIMVLLDGFPNEMGYGVNNGSGEPFVQDLWDRATGGEWGPIAPYVQLFSPGLLKIHRDSKIAIPLEYDNGTHIFNVVNNNESYNALTRICCALPIENAGSVMWKNLDGIYYQASISDMQELFKVCYRREQSCRNAESFVLNKNTITPYSNILDAIEDFDEELGD